VRTRSLAARATRIGDRVRVVWRALDDSAVRSYAVVAAVGEAVPTYPPGPGEAVVARTRTETSVTIAARRKMRVLVVALDAGGRVVAKSAILEPA
jgi:hypothetical protein